jgi:hypothetical protein
MATITKTQKSRLPKSNAQNLNGLKTKKRIPVDEVYWKKGMYKELVEDPFNLKS